MNEELTKLAASHRENMLAIRADATRETQKRCDDHVEFVEAPWLYVQSLLEDYLERRDHFDAVREARRESLSRPTEDSGDS